MILTSTERISGKRVTRTIGLAHGAVTRSTGLGKGITAFIKSLMGGELEEHTKILAEAREHALDRLREHARSQGANAVISIRFASSEIASYAAEIIVYGTAVVIEDDAASES